MFKKEILKLRGSMAPLEIVASTIWLEYSYLMLVMWESLDPFKEFIYLIINLYLFLSIVGRTNSFVRNESCKKEV